MKRASTIAALSLAALLLTGCSAAGGSSTGSAPMVDGSKGVSDTAGGAAVAAPNAVVTTGQVGMTVKDPIAAADRVSALATASGGSVATRSDTTTDDGRSDSTLTLRVPAAQLDSVLSDVRSLGTVTALSLDSTDVSSQVTDLSARITALQTSVDRLLVLMQKATSTDDLLSIEKTLSDRQADLDALTAQKTSLDDQVALSTVTVTFLSPGIAPAPLPHDFLGGLVAGWTALVATVSGATIVVGVLLPWLVLLGLIAAGIIAIVRLARRRRPSEGVVQS